MMRHNGCVLSWMLQMQHMCMDALDVTSVSGYAVSVAWEGSYVRDTRCVCKGCVLGNEQPMVNVAHFACVYGLKPYAFVRVVCDYE